MQASAKTPAECKTIINRAQFEFLASVLQPKWPAMEKKLAELYPTMMVVPHKSAAGIRLASPELIYATHHRVGN
jgi:hypothetical protein